MDDLLGDLIGDLLVLGTGRRARLKKYRAGEPVIVRAKFIGGFPWAKQLLCQQGKVWAASNRGQSKGRRQEIPQSRYKTEPSTWKYGPGISLTMDGQPLRILVAAQDYDLLLEVVGHWGRPIKE